MYHHIVIPTDGSPLSELAIDQGLELARSIGARLTLVTVIEPFRVFAVLPAEVAETRTDYLERMHEYANGLLAAGAAKAKAAGVIHDTRIVESDQPYRAIIDTAAEQGADLIAMASHGRRGISGLVLGSETVKVLTHSTVPVLVYRQAAAA
ncbi:MAG: universal stress protein [Lautropia sp.]